MAGIGAIASIGGGMMGQMASAAQQAQALQLQQTALNNLQAVNTPEAQQLMLALQQYQSAGQLNPNMEGLQQQGPSALNNISTDPRLMNAAMQSLQTLQKTGSGALQPGDLAALQQIKNSTNSQAQAQQQAILQNMAQRGISGGGSELAAQLQSGQNAANMANSQDLQVGANASQRALQAMTQAGVMGGQLQNQSFQQQAQQAAAQNAINAFNTMNAQQVGNTNTGIQNSAQAANLANAQAIQNANTGVANQQATYNAQVPQQVYQNQLGKAQAALGETNTLANTNLGMAANTQGMYSGIGNGLNQGISAYQANAQQQQQQGIQNNYNQQYLDVLKNAYGQGGSGGSGTVPPPSNDQSNGGTA